MAGLLFFGGVVLVLMGDIHEAFVNVGLVCLLLFWIYFVFDSGRLMGRDRNLSTLSALWFGIQCVSILGLMVWLCTKGNILYGVLTFISHLIIYLFGFGLERKALKTKREALEEN